MRGVLAKVISLSDDDRHSKPGRRRKSWWHVLMLHNSVVLHCCMQGIEVHDWDAFHSLAKGKTAEPVPPKPDDAATIMYTSGTTGAPRIFGFALST